MWGGKFRKKRRQIALITTFLTVLIFCWIFTVSWWSGTRSFSLQTYIPVNDRVSIENGFLLDTPSCQIPDFDPWAPSIASYFSPISTPIQDCTKFRHWTYINKGNELIYNETAINGDGYSWAHISCCVTEITRITQLPSEEDKEADNLIKYSECYPSNSLKSTLLGEFYLVVCHRTLFGFKIHVVYRDFHALTPKQVKVETEPTQSQRSHPLPNILILGIDSTSRLNFRRMMPQTVKALESLGAVELMGYTKVGDNTFPNFCAMLTGESESSLSHSCYPSRWTKLDNCPWIFTHLQKEAGYLTALAEDSPFSTGFNHYRTGFVRQPVDYYFRPFMISVHDQEFLSRTFNIRNYFEGCVGHRTNDEALIDYAMSVMDTAAGNSRPAFVMSWSSAGSHDDVTGISHSDRAYASALGQLQAKGHLNNTLLLVMSDHGYRYGPVRETRQGWFEDKLPAVWLYLGSDIVNLFPSWGQNLRTNSRRLSSPFVLHETFTFLVNTFANPNKITTTGKMPNFLESEIHLNATCHDLGIPEQYCACHYPRQIGGRDLDLDPNVQAAAKAAVGRINEILLKERKCSPLTVDKVISAGRMKEDGTTKNWEKYFVVVETSPGRFVVEAKIDYDTKSGGVVGVPEIHRTSKMNPEDISCLDGQDAELELWCYCMR